MCLSPCSTVTAQSKNVSVLLVFLEEQQQHSKCIHGLKTDTLTALMSDLAGDQFYRIFLQRINEQGVSKYGPAVLCHFGLLLGPDGTRGTC